MLDFPHDGDPRDEWGDWIEHFGGGCPLRIGDVFQPVLRLKHWDNAVMTLPSVLTERGKSFDIWMYDADAEYSVIKYRLLKDMDKLSEWNIIAGRSVEKMRDFCRIDLFPQQTT